MGRSAARPAGASRLIKQGAVKLNDAALSTSERPLAESAGVLKVGFRHFRKLVIGG